MVEARKVQGRIALVFVGLCMVVAACVLVSWFRGAPLRRRGLIRARSSHIGSFIFAYVDEHGAPPFAASGTFDEYLAKLVEYPLGDELEEVGRHCVFINLRPEEWAAVRAYLDASTAEGRPRLLAGWVGDRAESGSRRSWRRVLTFEGTYPVDTDKFRAEVLAMAEAVREALGKSLTDCLIYSEDDFDPSLLEPPRPATPSSSRDSNDLSEQLRVVPPSR